MSRNYREQFSCTTYWYIGKNTYYCGSFQTLEVLQQLIIINPLDFLVKFILQVFKWYMFPGIVLTMTFSILPIN